MILDSVKFLTCAIVNRLIDAIGSLEEIIAKDFPEAVLAFPKKQPIVGPIAEIAKLASLF